LVQECESDHLPIKRRSPSPRHHLAGLFSLLILTSPLARATDAPTTDNAAASPAGPNPMQQVLARGWGYVVLISGEVAFREHVGAHTDVPDWPVFLDYASRYLRVPQHAAPRAGP
jgi:hypothetical protein